MAFARRAHRRRRILLIDNRDSFTASLTAACRALGCEVEVLDNEHPAETAFDRALQYGAFLMLSPGQGGPRQAGCCLDLIALAAGRVPLIGICLGHQAIVEHAGGTVVAAHEPSHGKCSSVDHDGAGPFAGLASPMQVGRYHSLCTPIERHSRRLAGPCRSRRHGDGGERRPRRANSGCNSTPNPSSPRSAGGCCARCSTGPKRGASTSPPPTATP